MVTFPVREVVLINQNPKGSLLKNINLLGVAFQLNSNPMALSVIYTVKIVIRFSTGQSLCGNVNFNIAQ